MQSLTFTAGSPPVSRSLQIAVRGVAPHCKMHTNNEDKNKRYFFRALQANVANRNDLWSPPFGLALLRFGMELANVERQEKENFMPEPKTLERARQDESEGKAPSTQAGEFVREEFHHIRVGKHGARSTKQAIAIGLSKARRAGVRLAPPKKGRASEAVRRHAESDYEKGARGQGRPSARRSRAVVGALRREGHSAASPTAISRQARRGARNRLQRRG